MVKVGDKISAQIIVDGDLGLRKQTKTGEVTYVHPKGYWCRVKFHLGGSCTTMSAWSWWMANLSRMRE